MNDTASGLPVFLVLLALSAMPLLAGAAPEANVIQGFRAEFEASYIGFKADAVMELQQDAASGEYIYTVTTKARGLARMVRSGTGVETSRFRYDGETYRSISYTLDDGTEAVENDTQIRFDWDTGIAYSNYKGEAQDIQLEAGLLDRLTADVYIIQQLRKGNEPDGYDITDRNSVRHYDFTALGEETVTVPAGTYKAVKYLRQRPGSSRATRIWYAPELDYLPLRIEQLKRGDVKVVAVAVKLERT